MTMPCALAADAKLETPEGPLTVRTVDHSDAGEACVSDGGVGVTAVADGGTADLSGLSIRRGERLVLSAGLVAPAAP